MNEINAELNTRVVHLRLEDLSDLGRRVETLVARKEHILHKTSHLQDEKRYQAEVENFRRENADPTMLLLYAGAGFGLLVLGTLSDLRKYY